MMKRVTEREVPQWLSQNQLVQRNSVGGLYHIFYICNKPKIVLVFFSPPLNWQVYVAVFIYTRSEWAYTQTKKFKKMFCLSPGHFKTNLFNSTSSLRKII